MKNIFIYIIFGMVIGVVLGYCGRGGINKIKDAKNQRQLEQTQELIVKQATKDMIKKHNAITNFERNLIFTSQLQETILGTNERPVYLDGTISDIQKKDNKYILYLAGVLLSSDVIYELIITQEQYKNILSIRKASNDIYIQLGVVAIIKEISKPAFSIDAESEAEDDARITINSAVILVKGISLDIAESD